MAVEYRRLEYCLFWAICCLVVAMHSYYAGGIWG